MKYKISVINFKNIARVEMTGYLGNDWCPAEQDHKFLMDLWDKAVEENDEKMKYLLNLQLFDGYGKFEIFLYFSLFIFFTELINDCLNFISLK